MSKKLYTLCENWCDQIGCYNTFDGKCRKEECQTYRLIQLHQKIEKDLSSYKGLLKVGGKVQVKAIEEYDKLKNKLDKIENICKYNKLAGWVDVESIIEVIKE